MTPSARPDPDPAAWPEDDAIVRGALAYVDDLVARRPDPPARVVYVRSTMAHARILAIGTALAVAAPGVLAVVTDADVDLMTLSSGPPLPDGLERTMLARDRVRFVGEPVAAVVATTLAQALDAAALVHVEYGALGVLATVEAAAMDDEVLYPHLETNAVVAIGTEPLPEDLDAPVGESVTVRFPRVAAAPLETRAGLAEWGADGRLTLTVSSQGPHHWKRWLSVVYDLEAAQVRVVTPAVGGAFGSKAAVFPEILLLPWLARLVGCPVHWSEARREHTLVAHCRAALVSTTLGGGRDGRFHVLLTHMLQDLGAYPGMGALQPFWATQVFTGPYRFPAAEFSGAAVVTNLAPLLAVRAAGRTEAIMALERAVDEYAASVGLDPAEVRRMNLLAADDFPYAAAGGGVYDSGDYAAALDRVLAESGYADLRAEQARRRAEGGSVHMGIGVVCWVDVSGAGDLSEFASCTLEPDGSFTVRSGTTPSGQHHHTVWAEVAARVLGVDPARVAVRTGDTDDVRAGAQTGGSRSAQVGASAVHEAAMALVALARAAAPADGPVDWAARASARAEAGEPPLVAEHLFQSTGYAFPFGAQVAVVDVDAVTGQVTIRSLVAVDDPGTVLDRAVAEGQVRGALAMGIGHVMGESIPHDAFGQPLLGASGSYPVDRWSDLPEPTVHLMETPSPLNPLGAKGVGEGAITGVGPVVVNAVIDALRPLGVTHLDPPLTPERVWRAIRAATP